MTAYTGIQGQNILIVSSDPANPTEGQIWYNSTSNLLKGYKAVYTWATGGNINTPRGSGAGAGTKTAGLIFGGTAGVPRTLYTNTESYNGTSWTTVNAMPATRILMGSSGTQTAALSFGGRPGSPPDYNSTISWNGTSWSTPPATLNTARSYLGGCGTQTAALAYGSGTATEAYNGTSWTTVNAASSPNSGRANVGIQTAALGVGGYPAGTAVESWNGTNWTTIASKNVGANQGGGGGTQTAGLAFGGYFGPPAAPTTSEVWNGTSWTVTSNLVSATAEVMYGRGGAPTGATFGAGGYTGGGAPGFKNASQTFTDFLSQTITTS
jgi:hypothetical protein